MLSDRTCLALIVLGLFCLLLSRILVYSIQVDELKTKKEIIKAIPKEQLEKVFINPITYT